MKMKRILIELDDELHRKLKSKASEKGIYLKDYVISILKKGIGGEY